MSTLRLHHVHQSRSMRSLWLLHELGLDFELVIHPFGRALRAPEYLAIHPLGRVPCLEIDGRVLFESGAICEYLCETRDPRGLWRPPGDAERADWLQYLHYAETIAAHVANLTQQHVVIREDADRSALVMKLEVRRLEKALGVLDTLLEGQDYLLQSGFSAVDTAIGYSVYAARHFTRLDRFPAVSRYYRRLSARPAFARSLPDPARDTLLYRKDFYPPAPR